jgi:Phage terminase, small subunit
MPTQAAIKAGYSSKTANQIAAQNLVKLNIQKCLKNETDPLEEETEISKTPLREKNSKLDIQKYS